MPGFDLKSNVPGDCFFCFFLMEKADSFEYHHECEKDNLFSVPRTNITGSLLDRSRVDTAIVA